MIFPSRSLSGLLLVGSVSVLACGGGPTGPGTSTTTSAASTTTTTTVAPTGVVSQRYTGTLTPPPPQQPVPLDLSLFFNLPAGPTRRGTVRPLAVYQVTGGYNTGPGGFTGSVTGTLDGTLESGTFSGVLTANLPGGCVARRNYAGPLTRDALNWTPGAQIETCGGATPLTAQVNPPADPRPVTTSVATSTIASTTTSAGSTTTTTVPATTTVVTTTAGSTTTLPTTTTALTTTTLPTTTTALTTTTAPTTTTVITTTTAGSTTSVLTTTTVSTTTTTVQSVPSLLVVTITPSPVPATLFTSSCAGSSSPIWTWTYLVKVTNLQGGVPLTVTSWRAYGSTNFFPVTPATLQNFQQVFGTNVIGPDQTVQATVCSWETQSGPEPAFIFIEVNSRTPNFTSVNGLGSVRVTF